MVDYHHCLNLSASKTIDIVPLKSFCEIVGEVISFFHRSPKKIWSFGDVYTELLSFVKKNWWNCATHDLSSDTFSQLLPFILDTLENMQTWKKQEVKSTAYCYLNNTLTHFEFLFSLEIMSSISSHFIVLSRSLQTRGKDLNAALEEVQMVIWLSIRERANVETTLREIYGRALTLAKSLDVTEAVKSVPCTEAIRVTRNALLKNTFENISLLQLFSAKILLRDLTRINVWHWRPLTWFKHFFPVKVRNGTAFG